MISSPVRIAATAPASSRVRIAARCALPPKISQLPAHPRQRCAVIGRGGADDQSKRHVGRRASGAWPARHREQRTGRTDVGVSSTLLAVREVSRS